jgi:predicted metal-binding protein
MEDKEELEKIFSDRGVTDFRWIDPGEIVTGQWVRMKCMFGCGNYGKHACCPPNVPPVAECRQMLSEYTAAVIFHFPLTCKDPDDRRTWSKKMNETLLKIEKEVFLRGYYKTLLLPMTSCNICEECSGTRQECKNPSLARPTPEGMAIDVYLTARKHGFPIKVLTDYDQTANRYAFLLIE